MTARRIALVAMGLGTCALLTAAVGCSKGPFTVTNQKIVQSVSAQGKPGAATTSFTTHDRAAYCYFEYRNAPPNTSLQGEITFIDPSGTRATQTVPISLTPGKHKASFGIENEEGATLEVGTYEVQLYHGEQELFGTPLRFTVLRAEPEPTPKAANAPDGADADAP